MTLSSMVVSRDWQEVSVLECILGSLHMDVAVEKAPERALARLNKNKIDALIVDCDLDGTSQFLRELQREHRYPNTVPLVIMGGRHRSAGSTELQSSQAGGGATHQPKPGRAASLLPRTLRNQQTSASLF